MKRQLRILLLVSLALSLLAGVGCGDETPTAPGGGSGTGSIDIDGSRVDLKGYIESVGDSKIVVYDRVVLVTDNTELDGPHGDDLVFGDLLVGMWVEVRGTLRGDGVIVAERVKVEDDDYSSSY